MTGGVKTRGFGELERTLGKAADDLGDLSDAERAAAQVIAARAAQLAPRRTGRLATGVAVGGSSSAWAVVDPVRYAGYVHWGTRRMRARPFILAAAAQTSRQCVEIVAAEVDDVLHQIKGA